MMYPILLHSLIIIIIIMSGHIPGYCKKDGDGVEPKKWRELHDS
jgi:hypothetical protein